MVTRDAPRFPSSKVMTLEAAASWRRTVRGAVVFTNGVFDLLHPGHVDVLDRARREGAALIDMSSFSKFEVSGKGAFSFLQWQSLHPINEPVNVGCIGPLK